MDWLSAWFLAIIKSEIVQEAGKVGALTAAVASLAIVVAVWSLAAQKRIARRRAAIDFLLKTEMDKEMLAAYGRYRLGIDALKSEPDVAKFAAQEHCKAVRAYLNVHELMAIGIRQKILDDSVCYRYWHHFLDEACKDAGRLLQYYQQEDRSAFSELVRLHARWCLKYPLQWR